MRTFVPKGVEAQKIDFARNVRRRLSRQKTHLADKYSSEIAQASELNEEVSDQICKINVIHDRIADAADKEFGGWYVWRHNHEMLKEVCARMDEASKAANARVKALHVRTDKLLSEYWCETQKAEREAKALLRTL